MRIRLASAFRPPRAILPVWTTILVGSLLLSTACTPAKDQWQPDFFAPVAALVEQAIQDSVFPGAVLLVGKGTGEAYTAAYGHHDYSAEALPTGPGHLFDLASLTKVMATTLAIMRLYEQEAIALDAPVATYIPRFAQNGKDQVTVRNLLAHTSGFPAGRPFYLFAKTEEEAYDSLYATPLRYETGTATIYSDLSFITLGHLVEVITGTPLETYIEMEFYQPLGLQRTMFMPPAELWPAIVPAEPEFNFRLTNARGRAKNKITHLMNGVTGHAGLFSNVSDLAVLARMLLAGGSYDGGRLFDAATVRLFTSRQSDQSSRALGWDTGNGNLKNRISSGFSPGSFGHTGFTGTSIWIDPDRDLFIIFLSNRTYDMTDRGKITAFRPVLYDAVLKIVDADDS